MSRGEITYLRARIVATSPLKLSSGTEGYTDSDVLVDAAGRPFIPGTTLCGVIRHHLSALHETERVGRVPYDRYWFGFAEGDQGSESRVTVLDSFSVGSNPVVSRRDGVALDPHSKTAAAQAKYDYEVVDVGTEFRLRMLVRHEADESAAVDELLRDVVVGLGLGDVRIGGKTTRGFGSVSLKDVQTLRIDLETPGGVREYIGFDWEASAFHPLGGMDAIVAERGTKSPYEGSSLSLALAGRLMIRDYATTVPSGHEQKLVDAEALRRPDPGCADGSSYVIPGTTWAGAFRSHMLKVLEAAGYDGSNERGDTAREFLDRVFGTVPTGAVDARATKSRISFSESVIRGAVPLPTTRTSVDRFTGGAANQHLFTTLPVFGGTTELEVRWERDIDPQDRALLGSLVEVCRKDLVQGVLAVGGMTAVGMGVFDESRAGGEGRHE